MGLTRIARRAGTMQATRATAIRRVAVAANVAGSDDGTPYRNLASDRAATKPPILLDPCHVVRCRGIGGQYTRPMTKTEVLDLLEENRDARGRRTGRRWATAQAG